MPLSESCPRREVHQRVIDMKTFARDDGLFDVEAHLVDRRQREVVKMMWPEHYLPPEGS